LILATQNILTSSTWSLEHSRPPIMIHQPSWYPTSIGYVGDTSLRRHQLTINSSTRNMLPETTKLPNYLPYYTSRSGQIIEPQLNRGSIRSPARRSFVPIYFKISFSSSNRKGLVSRIFFESRRYHLSSGEGAPSPRRPLAEPTSSRHRLCRQPESPALQGHESLEHLALIFPSPPPFRRGGVVPPSPMSATRVADAPFSINHDPFFRPLTIETIPTNRTIQTTQTPPTLPCINFPLVLKYCPHVEPITGSNEKWAPPTFLFVKEPTE